MNDERYILRSIQDKIYPTLDGTTLDGFTFQEKILKNSPQQLFRVKQLP